MKQRATLLCDYSGVKDLIHETMEMLAVSKVMKLVQRLVSSRTVVVVEGVVEAFSVNFRPNLASHLDSFSFLC